MTEIKHLKDFYSLDPEDQIVVRKYLNEGFLAYKLQIHAPRTGFYSQLNIVYKKQYPEQENISDKEINEGLKNTALRNNLKPNEIVILGFCKLDVSPELFFELFSESL